MPDSEAYRAWAALIGVKLACCDKMNEQHEQRNQLVVDALDRLQRPAIDHPAVDPIHKLASKLSFHSLASPVD